MEVTGVVKMYPDGSAQIQLSPVSVPEVNLADPNANAELAVPDVDPDGGAQLAIREDMPPTAAEVASKAEQEGWAFHPTKLPLVSAAVQVAVSNTQTKLKLRKGPE